MNVQFEPGSEQLINSGFNSEVYALSHDRIVKLFLPWVPSDKVDREFRNSKLIHAAGLPVPEPLEQVTVQERLGIVFARVHGETLLKSAERRPWTLFRAARQLAHMHASVHAQPAPDALPPQSDQLEGWIAGAPGFSEQQKAAARERVASLPKEGGCLCHGDFHPANVFLTATGPVIIDWADATRGDALVDVARTSVLFESAQLPPGTPWYVRLLMRLARQALHKAYLQRYLQLRPGSLEEIDYWRLPQRMAAPAWKAERVACQERYHAQLSTAAK